MKKDGSVKLKCVPEIVVPNLDNLRKSYDSSTVAMAKKRGLKSRGYTVRLEDIIFVNVDTD